MATVKQQTSSEMATAEVVNDAATTVDATTEAPKLRRRSGRGHGGAMAKSL